MSEIFGYIANFGFPMVISIFLLVRIENRLEQLSASIHELAKAILVRPPG